MLFLILNNYYHRVIVVKLDAMSTFVSLLLLRMLSCISDMATSSTYAVGNVVPSNLKCSICLELFNDPHVLPCFHTYCLKCLQGLVSNKKSDLRCPQCRAKHKIPKEGVDSYLCDLSILPELETAKATTNKDKTKICDFCTTGDVAVGFCNDCSEYLCECCRDVVHKRGKMFVGHTVVSLEEATSSTQSIHARVIIKDSFCLQHSNYKLEIVCKTCNILVCCKCMLETTHKGHKYDFFEKVQDEILKQIKSMTQRVKEKEAIVKNSLSFVEKFGQQVCSERDKLDTEINAACDEYITKIQTMKEELLKQVESKFTKDSKTIWATKNHLQVILSQVESCQAFSGRLKKKQGSEKQMFALMNQLLCRLTELDSMEVNLSVLANSGIPHTKLKKSPLNVESVATLCDNEIMTFTKGSLLQTTAKLGKKTTLVYILSQPLAQLAKWKCEYYYSGTRWLASSCPVVVTGDNRLDIEFTPKHQHSREYIFHLIPTGCPLVDIQKFTVNVEDHVKTDDEKQTYRDSQHYDPFNEYVKRFMFNN